MVKNGDMWKNMWKLWIIIKRKLMRTFYNNRELVRTNDKPRTNTNLVNNRELMRTEMRTNANIIIIYRKLMRTII